MQYHSTQVLDRMLLAWRLALRRRLKIAKSARKAHNTLALRRAWCVWRLQLEQNRREALLKTFEAHQLKNIFLGIIFISYAFQVLTWLFSSMDAAHGTGTNA
jgi:protein SFI1